MDLKAFGRWMDGPRTQLFSSDGRLLIRQNGWLSELSLSGDYSASLLTSRPLFSQDLFRGLQLGNEWIAFHCDERQLELFHLQSWKQRSLKQKSTLLGYHYSSLGKGWNLLIVRSDGFELLRVIGKDLKVKSTKEVSRSIGHYWFERGSGLLVLALSPPKLGCLRVYSLSAEKLQKPLKAHLDVFPCVTDMWTYTAFEGRNLTSTNTDAPPHEVSVLKLYSETFLVHVHCLSGSVSLFEIHPTEVKLLAETYRVAPGHYAITAVENLLVLQNFTDQTSYLFDIQSSRRTEAVCVIWHGIPAQGGSVTFRVYIDRSTTDYFPELQLKYDGKVIKQLGDFTGALDVARKITLVECEWKLRLDWPKVRDDVYVNPSLCECLRLSLDIKQIAASWVTPQDCIPFLLRRSQKEAALDYSLHVIEREHDLRVLNPLLSSLINPSPMAELLSQSELHNLLFRRLYLSLAGDPEYISMVLLAFFYTVLGRGLEVHANIQFGFAQFLLRSRKLEQLQLMLRYGLLSDSPELAFLLTAFHVPAISQEGMDMLFRLRMYDDMFPLLFEKKLYYEFLCLMALHTEVRLPSTLISAFISLVPDPWLTTELQMNCYFRQPPPS